MQFKQVLYPVLASLLLLFVLQSTLLAQKIENTSTPKLPSDPTAWINSAPISNEALKGKAAVLFYFEETCGRCRSEWPERLKEAKSFEGKPVLFIAVNSGTPRDQLEKYLSDVGCDWPTICDPTRSLEKISGVGEITLQNIYQAKIITAEGDFRFGNPTKLKETAETALEGAAWRIDPSDIPAALKPAWSCLEFDNCALAAGPIKKALASKKPELKEAAEKLNASVQSKIEKLLTQAKEAEETGEKWTAYKAYEEITKNYSGYEVKTDIAKAKKSLSTDEAVQKQLAALKKLKAIQKSITTPSGQRTAKMRLQKLIADEPGSDAALEAQAMLEQAEN